MKKQDFIDKYGLDAYRAQVKKCSDRNRKKYNKQEYIKKYGIDAYNEHKLHCSEHNKTRYHNDTEYRISHIMDMKQNNMENYVRDGELEKIENYELAKADNFKGWCIHHRLQFTINGERALSKNELIRFNMYYNRPYFELI